MSKFICIFTEFYYDISGIPAYSDARLVENKKDVLKFLGNIKSKNVYHKDFIEKVRKQLSSSLEEKVIDINYFEVGMFIKLIKVN